MQNKSRIKLILAVSVLYWALAAMYIYWPAGLDQLLRPCVKAMPILLLAGLLYKFQSRYSLLPVAALMYSASGDIAGDTGHSGFIPSIAFFGIAQILYAVTFARGYKFSLTRLPFAALFLVSISILVYRLSHSPSLPDPFLKAMVFSYTGVISVMVLTALFSVKYSQLIPIGAFVFAISDSLIAWDRFISPVDNSGFWVMFTYGIAQYMITIGLIYSTLKEPSNAQPLHT